MWFVYVLECRDNSFYTGITTDLDKRMDVHESGRGSKYVARKGFKRLLYAIEAENRSRASKLEYRIKQLQRHEKLEFFRAHDDLVFDGFSLAQQ